MKFANANQLHRNPGSAPDFLYAALDTTACAAFIKESRMKFANANQLHRNPGSAVIDLDRLKTPGST